MKIVPVRPMFVLIVLFTILATCKNDTKGYRTGKLSLVDVEYYNCFGVKIDYVAPYPLSDTAFCTIQDDTLYLKILKDYSCCGLLKDSIAIENNLVNIYIADTCIQGCQCRCVCSFDYLYRFTEFWQTNTHFNIYFQGYGENSYKLWMQTVFIDGLD